MMWDVRDMAKYQHDPDLEEAHNPIKALFYVKLDSSARPAEAFRFPIFGGQIQADICGKDVFKDPALRDYRFHYEIEAGRIEIRENAFTAKWEDLEELLARGQLVAFLGSSKEDVTDEVQVLLSERSKADPLFGASLRWSVQARTSQELFLVLQFLPGPARQLRMNSKLNTDTCGAVEVARILLTISSFQVW